MSASIWASIAFSWTSPGHACSSRGPAIDDPIVRLDPVLDVERRIEDRLKLVVLLLGDRLELVVVALGALESQSQERRADDLDRSLEHGVLVGADLVGVAVALARAVLSVPQKMGRDEQVDRRRGGVGPATVAGQLVAGQLFADDLVERPIGVERADDIVAVAIGERAVGVGAEVSVGIGVARRIQPVLAPALAVARRGQQAIDELLVGVGTGSPTKAATSSGAAAGRSGRS